MLLPDLTPQLIGTLNHVPTFTRCASNLTLRRYQEEPALAIADSVIHDRGLSFVIIFPRQSGKNELQAQLEAYLMILFANARTTEIVKVSPTWKPQSLNAMRRLERVLSTNLLTKDNWVKEQGYIYRIGNSRIYFFSGQPESNIVGATANFLLEVDEAQDIRIQKYDKDISPMAASANATRVFWGTAWTSRTLLAREMRACLEAERKDGIKRVFKLSCEEVSREVPAYGKFVQEQIAKFGRNHPLIKTQYFSEEIDAEGSLFNPNRTFLMHGSHPARQVPAPGKLYAILIDVAGVDEAADALANPGRDSTALTIVEADLSTVQDALLQAPTYRVVNRRLWTGTSHARLYTAIRAICEGWSARYIVIDATGVGTGITSFLQHTFGERVIPFVFTTRSKSKLGWDFLSVIDSGRWKEHAPTEEDDEADHLQRLFFQQLRFIQYEIVSGGSKHLRWSVPEGTRDPATGELVHDDLVMSAALVSLLDKVPWNITGSPRLIRAADPIADMDRGF